VTVTLNVIEPPALDCTPEDLERTTYLGSGALSQSLLCTNAGGGSLSYTIDDDQSWIGVDPAEASDLGSGSTQTHTASYPGSSSLPLGVHTGTIMVDGGAAGSDTVGVTLTVIQGAVLRCSDAVKWGSATPALLTCANTGVGQDLSYSITELPDTPWLDVVSEVETGVPPSGLRQHLLIPSADLSDGVYQTTLRIDAGAAGIQDVPVEFRIPEPDAALAGIAALGALGLALRWRKRDV